MNTSCETTGCSAIQQFPNMICEQEVHCRFHKSPSLLPILSQINPIYFNSHLLHALPQPNKSNLFQFTHATCSAYLILLDFIILIILPEECNSRSFSWHSFLHPSPHFISSVQTSSSAPCSQTASVHVSPPNVGNQTTVGQSPTRDTSVGEDKVEPYWRASKEWFQHHRNPVLGLYRQLLRHKCVPGSLH
jgi:hypothetical protein